MKTLARATTALTLTLALVCSASRAHAADYGAKGTEATTTTALAAGTGGATGGKLVVPNGAGPYPLIVASHGFSASSDNQVGWAEHFASHGFVVVAPDFPNTFSPNHAANGGIVEALVGAVATAVPKADKTRVGLEGHSAGGLATTLAAAKIKPRAVVLFDPVDANAAGKTAYGTLCSPVLSIFSNPGACNSNGDWKTFATTSPGSVILGNLVNSTHCDGENAPRGLCGIGCGGGAVPARQTVLARYATAFFLAKLKGDTAAAATLDPATLSADTALANTAAKTGISCPDTGTGTDGGTDGSTPPPPPPPETDASTGSDSGNGGNGNGNGNGAGSDASTATGEVPTTDSGCSVTPQTFEGGGVMFALGLGAAVATGVARRSRRR
jgi:pimeloyl-ACP methyl ester carboxylesterase